MLAGRYRLEERVRTGPDGSAWRALDEILDRQVSVQVLRSGHPHAAEVVDAARRAALVEDARLLRVLDVGQENGTTYLVAERVPARLLSDLLTQGPVPAETARRLVGEAAQALDRAGARGLHHLRLTPRNLLVVQDGSVKVTGTAVDAAAAGVEVEAAGAAARIDAVSLVQVLYAALTSRWPGGLATDLPRAPRVAGRAVPPGDLVAGVPGDLDALCTAALGSQDGGPQTLGELASRLAPWSRVEPLTDPRGLSLGGPARPAGPTGRTGGIPVAVPEPARPAQPRPTPARTAGPGRRPGQRGVPPAGAPAAAATPPAVEGRSGVRPPTPPTPPAPAARPAPGAAPAPAVPVAAASTPPAPSAPSGPGAPSAPPGPPTRAPGTGRRPTPDPQPTAELQPTVVPDAPRAPSRGPGPSPAQTGSTAAPPSVAPSVPPSALGPARPRIRTPFRPEPSAGSRNGANGVAGPVEHGSAERLWQHGFGRPAPAEEPLGPFGPPVPVGRPPRDQSRLVILLLVGLLVVGLGLATWNLASFQGSDLVGPGPNPGAAAAAGPSATQDQPSSPESPAPSTAGAAGPPPEIAGIQAIDPEGDGNENGGSAPRAIDGDAGTAWRSERYGTPEFGGIKKGVGLVVDLADPSRVRQVTLQAPGTGGSVELRTAPGPGLDGSQVVATADIEGGPVVLTPARPVSTRYLVVWFTRVPRAEDGDNRILVEEIGVR